MSEKEEYMKNVDGLIEKIMIDLIVINDFLVRHNHEVAQVRGLRDELVAELRKLGVTLPTPSSP